MMKNLLILMLVLGLTSVASATLTMEFRHDAAGGGAIVTEVDQGQTFSIVIMSDNAAADKGVNLLVYDGYESGFASCADVVDFVGDTGKKYYMKAPPLQAYEKAGELANIPSYSVAYDGFDPVTGDWSGLDPNGVGENGNWFALDLVAGTTAGSTRIGFMNSSYTGWDSYGTITVLPEPATMLLLGIGGLLLRRRK